MQALAEKVTELTGGRLDILVNNAGRNYTVPAMDIEFDEVQSTFDANVFGVMRMCKEFAPLLIETKGTIVMIGSLAGYMPYLWASKLNSFFPCCYLERRLIMLRKAFMRRRRLRCTRTATPSAWS